MGSGFPPHVLPPGTPLLADGQRPPVGSIYVRSEHGGYAVPPRRFTLHFGRAVDDVHVAVGVDDTHVSRLHGVFTCDGDGWWLRCEGTLPIQRPGARMLLQGHEVQMAAGYTTLTIDTPDHRSHLLEVHVVGFAEANASTAARPVEPDRPTDEPDVLDLSLKERLVATVLAQRYLRQDPNPQPVSWGQAAIDLSRVDPGRQWTDSKAERVIADLRRRLATGPNPVRGILREDGIGEPVGNTLNVNLIDALLKSATLIPQDLESLGDDF